MEVGMVHTGQAAARTWCERTFDGVDSLSPSSLADGSASLSTYDVVWWHREAPLSDPWTTAALRPVIRSFLAGGGGLLLTLRALSAVAALGIDPVSPDATGVETPDEPLGLCWRAAHDRHPLAEGLDRRFEVAGADAAGGYARYESVLPERGELLASIRRGDRDVYDEMVAFAWSDPGPVVGIGTGLYFDRADGHAGVRSRVVENALRVLGSDSEFSLGRPLSTDRLASLRNRTDRLDPNRPRYHVTPPGNWLNDPNGLVNYGGRYHLFYQYNPAGPFHEYMHWGHAVSDDLVTWTDLPVALAPEPDGPDRDGCWSGCTVVDDGTPTALYTGVRGRWQLPCLATSDDPDLRSWEQSPGNPLVGAPPAEIDIRSGDGWNAHFRDHCVWREDDTWHQLIGSGIQDADGVVVHYTSPDLGEWTYEGPVRVDGVGDTGPVWECPELLDLGDRDLLHVSDYGDVRYFLGTFDGESFSADRDGLLDYGHYYAPQSLAADDGRTLTWGWLREARDERAQWDAGWSGALSLPRELSVTGDGRLRQRPARELTELRTDHAVSLEGTVDDTGRDLGLRGDAVELDLTVRLEDGATFELLLRAGSDGERTPLRYDGESLTVDRTASSRDDAVDSSTQRMPVADGPLSVRVFVDGSVVEVFANEHRCLSSRIYPETDADGYRIRADGGTAEVRLDGWHLGSAWT